MVKKESAFLSIFVFVALGILAKYVYTFDFTIGSLTQVSMNLVALPAITAGLLMGPLYGALVGGMVDVLGHILHPTGSYLPLITVMAVLRGLIPGILFQRLSRLGPLRSILFAVTLSQIGVSIILGSLILSSYFGTPFGELVLARSITAVFAVPLFCMVSYATIKQRRTWEQLQESVAQYESLVDNLSEVVFRCKVDAEWTMVFISQSIYDIVGYAASDFLQNSVRTYASLIHPEDRDRVSKQIHGQIGKEGSYTVTYRGVAADGATKWLRETGQAFVGQDGIKYIDGLIYDITELKQAEDALRSSESRYRSIIQVIPDVIIRCNGAGEYLDIHASSEDLLITSRDALLGRRIEDMLPERQGRDFVEAVRTALSNQSLTTIEYDLTVADGARWFEARLLPDGEHELVALIRDITTRKSAEQRAEDYLHEVELQREQLAQLYSRLDDEMVRARGVHNRLLQRPFPMTNDLRIETFHQPATYVGGDFFSVLREGEKLIVYLSDVTGHGLDGAMFSTFVENTVRSYVDIAREEDITPESIFDYLDARVRSDNYPSEYAVALFLIVFDFKTHQASYSGVGFQNAPVVMHNDGSCQLLVSQGLPISPDIPRECMEFTSKQILFTTLDWLFLATDGLYEQQSDAGIYEERLLSILRAGSGDSNEPFADTICQDFRDFLGERDQDDDVTFLIVYFNQDSTAEQDASG